MSHGPLPGGGDEPQIHVTTETKLVYMANQIADFFASQGHEERAVAGVADHLKSFWDPSMMRRMFAHFDETGGGGLKPVAFKAVQALRDSSPGSIRAELARTGGHSGREPGDDAG